MNNKLSSITAAIFGILAFALAIVSNHTEIRLLMIPALICASVSVFSLGKKDKNSETKEDC